MQSSGLGDKGMPRLIKGKDGDQSPTREYEEDSLHPGHAIDESGMQYRPDTEADTEGLLNSKLNLSAHQGLTMLIRSS
jgi:hypothetical protein